MPKPEKVERVAALTERIKGSDAMLLTEYRGLTVSQITQLRRSLAEGGSEFAVVKNTLMRRALAEAGVPELQEMMTGPSAVAFVDGDVVAAAKSVVKAMKEHPYLLMKGAFLDGKLLSGEDAKALADLESREVMLSKIAGLFKGEMSRAATMFQAAQSRFLGVLESYRDTLPGEHAVSDEPAAVEEPAVQDVEPETTATEEPTPETMTTTDEAAPSDEGKE